MHEARDSRSSAVSYRAYLPVLVQGAVVGAKNRGRISCFGCAGWGGQLQDIYNPVQIIRQTCDHYHPPHQTTGHFSHSHFGVTVQYFSVGEFSTVPSSQSRVLFALSGTRKSWSEPKSSLHNRGSPCCRIDLVAAWYIFIYRLLLSGETVALSFSVTKMRTPWELDSTCTIRPYSCSDGVLQMIIQHCHRRLSALIFSVSVSKPIRQRQMEKKGSWILI